PGRPGMARDWPRAGRCGQAGRSRAWPFLLGLIARPFHLLRWLVVPPGQLDLCDHILAVGLFGGDGHLGALLEALLNLGLVLLLLGVGAADLCLLGEGKRLVLVPDRQREGILLGFEGLSLALDRPAGRTAAAAGAADQRNQHAEPACEPTQHDSP